VYLERHGRGNNHISAIPADIYVSRLFETNEIACGALSLPCSQYVSVPILAGSRPLPDEPAQGRAWLQAIREKVPSAKAVADTVNLEKRWVSVALTWNGLRALGVDEASLATFPDSGKAWRPVGR
jgi:hypothetical protein